MDLRALKATVDRCGLCDLDIQRGDTEIRWCAEVSPSLQRRDNWSEMLVTRRLGWQPSWCES